MQNAKNMEELEMPKKKMESRRSTRNHVFNIVFQFNFLEEQNENNVKMLIDSYYDLLEYEEELELKYDELFNSYNINKKIVEEQAIGIFEKLEELDNLIQKNSESWSISRIDKVDLTILRLAIYEILFEENIPNVVAINEAIELSKEYSSEKAYKFVNAVLAKV